MIAHRGHRLIALLLLAAPCVLASGASAPFSKKRERYARADSFILYSYLCKSPQDAEK